MSYADQVFISVCRDILENGFRDDGLTVRPHWEDGTPDPHHQEIRRCEPL